MERRGKFAATRSVVLRMLNGRYRRDWATAGRNMVVRRTGIETPPLLHAATAGSLDSVEFFLSDKPHRLYSEFMKSKMAHEDSRIRAMQGRPGGFDRVIANWLGAESKCDPNLGSRSPANTGDLKMTSSSTAPASPSPRQRPSSCWSTWCRPAQPTSRRRPPAARPR